jgi:AcrR family transcriptional regulator
VSRRDEILAVAEGLLEREGPAALTMRRLAAELGMKAPSLYKHVSGRDDIEAGLQARALVSMGEALAASDTGLAGRDRGGVPLVGVGTPPPLRAQHPPAAAP